MKWLRNKGTAVMLVKLVVGGNVWQHSGSMDELLIGPSPMVRPASRKAYFKTHTTVLTYGLIFAVHVVACLKRGVNAAFILGLKCTLEFQAGAESQFNTLSFWLSLQSPKNFNLTSAQLKVSTPHPLIQGGLHHMAYYIQTATSCFFVFVVFRCFFLFVQKLSQGKRRFRVLMSKGFRFRALCSQMLRHFAQLHADSSVFFATAADCSCNSAYWKTRL